MLLNVPIGQGSDFRGVVSTLQVPADTGGALLNPAEISDPLVESIIEVDEAVMERYFEGEKPTPEELSRLIVQAVRGGTLIPIVCCSGKTQVGLSEVLDAVAMCGLSPADLARCATLNGEEVESRPRLRSYVPAYSRRGSTPLCKSSVLFGCSRARLSETIKSIWWGPAKPSK